MNTNQREAIDLALFQKRTYFTISLGQDQDFDDFVESASKAYPRWNVKAAKTVCDFETYVDLVFAKAQICNNCKHIASDTHGNDWDEPMVTDEYCKKGVEWEDVAPTCPLYEYYDWDAHYKAEAEAEYQYHEAMKLAEEEYIKTHGIYGIDDA